VADFAKLALTVKRLVEKNGRPMTVRQRGHTPLDANQPWRGNNPAGNVDTGVTGVILNFTLTPETSDFVRRGYRRCLVAVASAAVDLRTATQIVDGADTWEVVDCRVLEPGPTPLLYDFAVKK
jgi:hypothetical protein